MDFDNNGEIDLDEFILYWKMVKAAGHDEEEIMEELKNIQNGESFPGFNDLPM